MPVGGALTSASAVSLMDKRRRKHKRIYPEMQKGPSGVTQSSLLDKRWGFNAIASWESTARPPFFNGGRAATLTRRAEANVLIENIMSGFSGTK